MSEPSISPLNPTQQRILYVITKANWGGAQRYVYDLAHAAHTRGHTVAVAVGSEGVLADRLRSENVAVYVVPGLQRDIGIRSDWLALRGLCAIMRTLTPDVVHLNSSKAGVIGAIAARTARVPRIIFTAHGWPFFEERSLAWRTMAWTLSWLTTLLAHTTICVSEYDRTRTHFPFVRRKLTRIYNGITPPTLLSRTEAQAHLFPPDWRTASTNAPVVHLVAIGELHKNKNHALLIQALTTLQTTDPHTNVRLTIIGDGELRPILESALCEQNLSDTIHLVGFMSEPAQYLNAFDALVLPSKKEGLPYVLLEARASGIPIIASHVGGIPEIVSINNQDALINPAQPATLIDALRAVQPNRHQVATDHTHLPRLFTLEEMLAQTFATYRSSSTRLTPR